MKIRQFVAHIASTGMLLTHTPVFSQDIQDQSNESSQELLRIISPIVGAEFSPQYILSREEVEKLGLDIECKVVVVETRNIIINQTIIAGIPVDTKRYRNFSKTTPEKIYLLPDDSPIPGYPFTPVRGSFAAGVTVSPNCDDESQNESLDIPKEEVDNTTSNDDTLI